MTKYNYLILLIIGIVLISGCSSKNNSSTNYQTPNSTYEHVCSNNEELCIVGTPGLTNKDGMYSGSNSFFSIILRNNAQGQEAKNVKITLKNVGPFKIVEGECGDNNLRNPSDIRTILNSPNPEFIDDIGKPFATHSVGTIYTDEEIEFLWELKSPSFQEIANVAFDHNIGYDISYDYTTGVLQTIYVINEQEYQRILKNTGKEPDYEGTITSSAGALSIEKQLQEPIRLINNESQLPLKYVIKNEGIGIPSEPAMFLLQYPEGIDYIGIFDSFDSLTDLGYIDLLAAVKYYNNSGLGEDGGICLPMNFDNNSELLKPSKTINNLLEGDEITSKDCDEDGNFKLVTLDKLFAYIREEFPDLLFNETNPRFVIKFLYPTTLKSDINYLYYPMIVKENVEFTKPYTFRLKTKYRYSFSGEDSITIVPSVYDYDSSTKYNEGIFWGDFTPKVSKLANDYYLNNDGLNFETTNLTISSKIIKIKNNSNQNEFIHILKISNTNCDSEDFYNIRVGYNSMPNYLSEIDFDKNGYRFINCSHPIYYIGDYLYNDEVINEDYNSIDKKSHNVSKKYINCLNSENSICDNNDKKKCCIQSILNRTFFIEVKNLTDYVLTDNEFINLSFDYFNNPIKKVIPDDMRIVKYEDNESFKVIKINDNDLILFLNSQNDKMVLNYYYNIKSPDEFNSFDINISLWNITSKKLELVSPNHKYSVSRSKSRGSIELNNYLRSYRSCSEGVMLLTINETKSNEIFKLLINNTNKDISNYDDEMEGVVNVCRE